MAQTLFRAKDCLWDQLPSDPVETGWRESYWAGQGRAGHPWRLSSLLLPPLPGYLWSGEKIQI